MEGRFGGRNGGGNDGFRRGPRRDFGPREEHDATCSECGKTCKVPFKPKEDRPVYCQDCFKKRRDAGN